jgi:hypothetical protein
VAKTRSACSRAVACSSGRSASRAVSSFPVRTRTACPGSLVEFVGGDPAVLEGLAQLGPVPEGIEPEHSDLAPVQLPEALDTLHGRGLAPAPLGPRIPKISPSGTVKETSPTATASPYLLCGAAPRSLLTSARPSPGWPLGATRALSLSFADWMPSSSRTQARAHIARTPGPPTEPRDEPDGRADPPIG